MQVTADARPAKTGAVRSATSTRPAATRQLLRSFVSLTRCNPSAQARSRYEPGRTYTGTASLTVARDLAPGRIRATERAPSRTPSTVYTVLDRSATPLPRFQTASVTDTVVPCSETVTAVSTRSGRAGTASALPAHAMTSSAQIKGGLARVRLLHRPPDEDLHEMAPVLGAAVRVARRLRSLAGGRAGVGTGSPRRLRGSCAQRRRAHADERDRGLGDAAVRAPGHRRDADRRPVLRTPPELQVAPDVVAGRASARVPPSRAPAARRRSRRRRGRSRAAATVRTPSRPAMSISPSSASTTAGRSDAGSPCASEPPIVPRCRTCGSPIRPAAYDDERVVLLQRAPQSRRRDDA